MNPQAANLNPANALQAQPAGRKQSGSATADTPFSQVLSNEIAQNKPVNETKSDSRQDVQSGSDSASTDPTNATDSKDSKDSVSAEAPTGDPLNPTPASNGASQPDASQPVADAGTMMPDAMLALAAAPNLLIQPPPPPPAPTSSESVAGAVVADALGARAPSQLNLPSGTPAPALQPAQAIDAAADTQAAAAQQAVKADFQAAMTTATSAQTTAAAASLQGQIAAALSPDSLNADDTRTDGINTPLMAVTPHALLNTISAPASVASNALAPSVGSAAWGQALGEKIVWMTAGAQQTASLTLNPPNLGPLQIVLSVTNDQATASFFSAQPEVRHALEAALPKLREMMNDAGIQLGQTTVGAETQQQQHETANREARRNTPSYPGSGNDTDTGIQNLPLPIWQSGRGLVDTFA
ncbi:MAG: flagellar hook-length control protein FliK [Thiobacillus sp.]|nr:flagellar hook-length control protein FliK [Thiobacillus sp.]